MLLACKESRQKADGKQISRLLFIYKERRKSYNEM